MTRLGRLLALFSAVLVAASLLGASPVWAETEWAEQQTEHLVLRFSPAEADEVAWYAEFAEDAYLYVSDIFGQPPRPGVVLTFHSDEASYVETNPLAGREEAVLGHARPSARQIGLALWRLRKQPETLRRDAIRHELTHVVLGDVSENRLPIGLHEGLAQYVEQDPEQRAKLVRGLRRAVDSGQLLSIGELNRQRTFLSRAPVAYPQSYSVIAFLNDRYGFGHLVRLVHAARGEEIEPAFARTFGRPLSDLEEEWRAYLPSFLDGTWARNDLDLWEMAAPRRDFEQGRYAEAGEGFARATRLFEDLGRADKLVWADDYSTKSRVGVSAVDLTHRGAVSLERFEYEPAADLLGQAEAGWTIVGDESRRRVVAAGLEQARHGISAHEGLERARMQVAEWRWSDGRASASAAGTTFAELGDAPGAEQAEAIIAEVRDLETRAGTVAIAGGAIGLIALGTVWTVGSRRRRTSSSGAATGAAFGIQERDWSL